MNMKTPANRPVADLRAILLEALESTKTEDELAERIAVSGALGTIVDLATYDANQTAQALEIQQDSVRKLMRQSATFPRPAVNERRYARHDVQSYAETRQKKKKAPEASGSSTP